MSSSSLSDWETEIIESDLQDYMKEYCFTCNSICTKICYKYKVHDDKSSDEKSSNDKSSDEKSSNDKSSDEKSSNDKSSKKYEEISKHIIMNTVYEPLFHKRHSP